MGNIDKELYKHIGSQLRERREELNYSLDTLKMLIGEIKTKSTLKRYEDGESRIELDTLKVICDRLGLDYKDVIQKARNITANNSSGITIQIPLYSSISCGTGIFVDDNIEDYIVVPDRYIQRNKEYFANTARGDSMIGKGIKNNDVLVFEKTTFIENGEVGAFCIDESEAVCKIFRKLSSGIVLLESANPSYDPIEIDIMNNCFKVVGKYKFKFSIEQE